MVRYLGCVWLAWVVLLSGCDVIAPDKITANKNWKTASLENGMQYHFYYKKDQPVEVRLLVHAGSVQETEAQAGYAHFLEHMTFNGSKHFTGNEMIAEFEQKGLGFGPEINAYTSYEVTSYKLSLPDDALLDRALTWFRDIGDGLNLAEAQVEAEKGVVLGEIRMSLPQQKSMGDQLYDLMIEDTLLAQHEVLGSKESVQGITSEKLRAFYQQWYMPNNAELLIAGDFNLADAERLVKARFADWAAKELPQKTDVDMSHIDRFDPRYLILPEGDSSAISINMPAGEAYYHTLQDQRAGLQNKLINTLIYQRLYNRALEKKVEYTSLYVGKWNLQNSRYNYIDLAFTEEQRAVNQQFLASELASLREYGVSLPELQTALVSYTSELEQLDANWRQHTSQQIIERQEYSLRTGEVNPAKEDYRNNLARFIDEVDIRTLNQQLRRQLSSDNRLVVYGIASERTAGIEPDRWLAASAGQFSAALAQAGKQVVSQKFIDAFPLPQEYGKISASTTDPATGLHTWQLENGIEVWFKRHENAEQKVYLRYVANGGALMLPAALNPALELSYPAFMRSGLADMNARQLNDFLTRHNTSLFPELGDNQRSLAVTTTQKELTTAFAVLHEAATRAAVDSSQFAAAKSNFIGERRAYLDSPSGKYVQAINNAIYGPQNTEGPASVAQLSAVSAEQVDDVYQRLFRQQDDFKLIIVADMAAEELEPYLRQYVANISYQPGTLVPRAVKVQEGGDTVVVKASNEPEIAHHIFFSAPEHSVDTRELFTLDLLVKVLDRRLTSQVREANGLDYSPYVGMSLSATPRITTLYFGMTLGPQDKAKADKVMSHLIEQVDQGIKAQELAVAKSQLLTELEQEWEDAEVQANALQRYIPSGYDFAVYADPEPLLDTVTVRDLERTWNKLTSSPAHRADTYLEPKQEPVAVN